MDTVEPCVFRVTECGYCLGVYYDLDECYCEYVKNIANDVLITSDPEKALIVTEYLVYEFLCELGHTPIDCYFHNQAIERSYNDLDWTSKIKKEHDRSLIIEEF